MMPFQIMLLKHMSHYNWRYTVTQILANNYNIFTGNDFTAAMRIFVQAVKQVWY